MERPQIATALPKRRYQLGDYSATLLGDIESRDERRYRYILALVPMGEQDPTLYITSEPQVAGDAHDLRVISADLTDTMDSHPRWRDLDTFADQALDLAQQVLGLRNREPMRLL